ncbi:DoxX family protein [Jiella endophytica]|uniref:DoxX family protein n=1 Tax=Jiella endophytica TaxID=2558362 RepID=A0A4Y8RMR2_9HYPH|nr:DoxX family protein [Jiella endophytica]TFF24933.1 DoxX family protein [Jiella endophytica]
MNQSVILAGRVLLSAIFIVSGFGKLTGAEGFAGFLSSLNFPAPLAMAYLVGAFELVAGLAVLVGFQTRIVGIALALFCVATGILVHAGDQTVLLKNIAMAGGFLVLAGSGAGSIAIDKSRRESRYA